MADELFPVTLSLRKYLRLNVMGLGGLTRIRSKAAIHYIAKLYQTTRSHATGLDESEIVELYRSNPEVGQQLEQLVEAEIAHLDKQIGRQGRVVNRILKSIEELGPFEDHSSNARERFWTLQRSRASALRNLRVSNQRIDEATRALDKLHGTLGGSATIRQFDVFDQVPEVRGAGFLESIGAPPRVQALISSIARTPGGALSEKLRAELEHADPETASFIGKYLDFLSTEPRAVNAGLEAARSLRKSQIQFFRMYSFGVFPSTASPMTDAILSAKGELTGAMAHVIELTHKDLYERDDMGRWMLRPRVEDEVASGRTFDLTPSTLAVRLRPKNIVSEDMLSQLSFSRVSGGMKDVGVLRSLGDRERQVVIAKQMMSEGRSAEFRDKSGAGLNRDEQLDEAIDYINQRYSRAIARNVNQATERLRASGTIVPLGEGDPEWLPFAQGLIKGTTPKKRRQLYNIARYDGRRGIEIPNPETHPAQLVQELLGGLLYGEGDSFKGYSRLLHDVRYDTGTPAYETLRSILGEVAPGLLSSELPKQPSQAAIRGALKEWAHGIGIAQGSKSRWASIFKVNNLFSGRRGARVGKTHSYADVPETIMSEDDAIEMFTGGVPGLRSRQGIALRRKALEFARSRDTIEGQRMLAEARKAYGEDYVEDIKNLAAQMSEGIQSTTTEAARRIKAIPRDLPYSEITERVKNLRRTYEQTLQDMALRHHELMMNATQARSLARNDIVSIEQAKHIQVPEGTPLLKWRGQRANSGFVGGFLDTLNKDGGFQQVLARSYGEAPGEVGHYLTGNDFPNPFAGTTAQEAFENASRLIGQDVAVNIPGYQEAYKHLYPRLTPEPLRMEVANVSPLDTTLGRVGVELQLSQQAEQEEHIRQLATMRHLETAESFPDRPRGFTDDLEQYARARLRSPNLPTFHQEMEYTPYTPEWASLFPEAREYVESRLDYKRMSIPGYGPVSTNRLGHPDIEATIENAAQELIGRISGDRSLLPDVGGRLLPVANTEKMDVIQRMQNTFLMSMARAGANTTSIERHLEDQTLLDWAYNWIPADYPRKSESQLIRASITDDSFIPPSVRGGHKIYNAAVSAVDAELQEHGMTWDMAQEIQKAFGTSINLDSDQRFSEQERSHIRDIFGMTDEERYLNGPLARGNKVLGEETIEQGEALNRLWAQLVVATRLNFEKANDIAESFTKESGINISLAHMAQEKDPAVLAAELYRQTGGGVDLRASTPTKLIADFISRRVTGFMSPEMEPYYDKLKGVNTKKLIELRTGEKVERPNEPIREAREAAKISEEAKGAFSFNPMERIGIDSIRNAWKSHRLVRYGTVGAAAFVGAGLLHGVIHSKDRTLEDMQGPPYLPGGNPYQYEPDSMPDRSGPPSLALPRQTGMEFNVTANGNFDPKQFRQNLAVLLGTNNIVGSSYGLAPLAGQDNTAYIEDNYGS